MRFNNDVTYDKVFVTGATGLVGSHIVCELIKKGKIVGISYRDEQKLSLLNKKLEKEGLKPNYISYKTEIDSYEEFSSVLKGYDAVIHAAANVDLSKNSKKYVDINLNITKAVLWAVNSAGIKRFIHISSIATLGEPTEGAQYIDEKCEIDSLIGKSGYSIGKFYCENAVYKYLYEGLNGVILNPSVIIGCNAQKSSSSKIIEALAKKNKYFSSGITGYVGVKDVARAATEILDTDITLERLIVSNENLSYEQLMTKCANILGFTPPTKKVSDTLIKTVLNCVKLIEKMKFNAKYSSSMLECLVSKKYYDGSAITKCSNFTYSSLDEQLEESLNIYKQL